MCVSVHACRRCITCLGDKVLRTEDKLSTYHIIEFVQCWLVALGDLENLYPTNSNS